MIKKIILALFFSSFAFAAQVDWMPNYNAAVEKAKKENKLIFLMLTQPGCPTCVQMKEIIAKDEMLINEINSKFAAVEVNVLKDDWNKKFRVFGTPTFYFLDKNENKISRQFVGGAPGSEFLKIIKDAQTQR